MADAQFDRVRAVEWASDRLRLLDQRLLPQESKWIDYDDSDVVAQAIKDMVVRGAPAIGIAAGFAVVLAARKRFAQSTLLWKTEIENDLAVLAASRPTAVNLFWALDRMREAITKVPENENPVEALLVSARQIHNDDIAANKTMGDLGAGFIQPGSRVLTHCNAGALATGGYGTALGVIRSGIAQGRISAVFADETRPWLQGARLTAWELLEDDIDVTLICEGSAASLMQAGEIDWVIVGSDRIAANGDVANKIGTYGLAVLARYHGVKFMVAAPVSTVDLETETGKDIPIEERDHAEVLSCGGKQIAAKGAKARNLSFDVTPAELVDVIVTEKGAVERPDPEKMASLMAS